MSESHTRVDSRDESVPPGTSTKPCQATAVPQMPSRLPSVSSLKERGRSRLRTWDFVTGSSCFPAGCGHTPGRGRGQGSTGGRPASGLGLDAGSERRRIVAPGTRTVVCGGRVLHPSEMDVWRDRYSGRRSSLRCRRVRCAWSGTAAARRGQSSTVDRAPEGGHTQNGLASWLRRDHAHAARARQRMCPSRRP